MKFMRLHWFDVGFALALVTGGIVLTSNLTPLSLILWLSSDILVSASI